MVVMYYIGHGWVGSGTRQVRVGLYRGYWHKKTESGLALSKFGEQTWHVCLKNRRGGPAWPGLLADNRLSISRWFKKLMQGCPGGWSIKLEHSLGWLFGVIGTKRTGLGLVLSKFGGQTWHVCLKIERVGSAWTGLLVDNRWSIIGWPKKFNAGVPRWLEHKAGA